MTEPITKPRVSAAAKTALVLAAAAVLLAVFAQAAPGSKFFFPLVSLWCNLVLFACVLLVLDLAALVYFRRHLRQKKTMRVIATCVCGLLAALLLLYLALAAMLLFAASQN